MSRSAIPPAVVWVALVSAPATARAENVGYNDFQVGDRALGLAGAYVGLADDASAIYHNPGGLAPLPSGTLSTALWAQAVQIYNVKGGLQTDLGTDSLSNFQFLGLPFFIAATGKVGRKDAQGEKYQTVGAMIVSPYSSDLRLDGQVEATDSATGLPAVATFSSRIEDTATWVGVAYGVRLSEEFSFGVTTFATNRSYQVTQTSAHAERGAIVDLDPSSNQGTTFAANGYQYNLLFRLGSVWDPSQRVRVGLMLQPPAPAVLKSFSIDGANWTLDPETDSTDFEAVTNGSANVAAPIPWSVRAGATYFETGDNRVTLDASAIGARPKRYDLSRAIERAIGTPLPFAVASERVTFRGAVGYETSPRRFIPLRGGLLYEIEPGGYLNGRALEPRHVFGAAVGVSFTYGGYQVGLGTTVTYERSNVRLLAPDGSAALDAARLDKTTAYVYLSGGSRAAARLAEDLGKIGHKPKKE